MQKRIFLFLPTLKIISQYPIFGVGLGGYLPALAQNLPANQITPSILQPIHNIILLMLSEVGIIGMAIIIFIIQKTKALAYPFFPELLSIILLTGSFDHYWYTLPQNQLIMLIAIYLSFNKPKLKSIAIQ
jgi:O-antigen ligase